MSPAQVVRVDRGDEGIDNADLKAPTPRFPAGSRSYPTLSNCEGTVGSTAAP